MFPESKRPKNMSKDVLSLLYSKGKGLQPGILYLAKLSLIKGNRKKVFSDRKGVTFSFLRELQEDMHMKTREKTQKRKIWNPENRAPKQKRSKRDSQDDGTGSEILLTFKLRGESIKIGARSI